MGGKQKQAQRTKGNTKASSSARAAELVQSSGGFMGFGAMGGDLGYVPVTGADDLDSSVDPDFRMLLKKTTKKDTATKLKALSEIAALCGDKDADAVKSILPFWPRIYNKLAIDSERRVREASHVTFQQVLDRVGRDLAPHLKALIGPWLVAHCDPYGPAATAARAAFNAAFPPARQASALTFCKREILAHIEDNLFTQIPQTLSDPKTTEEGDMQSKYHRVLAGSLGAWRILLNQVPPQGDMIDSYKAILAKPAFWKLQKHQSELIRSSFYQVVSALCQSHPPEVVAEKDRFCAAVLYSLDDTAPLVCPALWEAVLHVVTTVQDWWTVINPRKGMLPKLWKLLRGGGEGSAYVIYPNLLPLLSTMPKAQTIDHQLFLEEFTNAITVGLTNEKVLASSREISSIMRAFVECTRFCMTNQTSGDDSQSEHSTAILNLLMDQLMKVLEACLTEKSDALHNSPFYRLLAHLLHSDDGSQGDATLTSTSRQLWRRVHELVMEKACASDTGQGHVTGRLTRLIGCLLMPDRGDVRELEGQKTKVKFATDDLDPKASPKTEPKQLLKLSETSADYRLVADLCRVLPEQCESQREPEGHIRLLCYLLQLCGGSLKVLSGDGISDLSRAEIVKSYLTNILLKLVGKGEDLVVLETSVSIATTVEKENVADVMESLLEDVAANPRHLSTIVTSSISLSITQSALRLWLSGENFGQRIVACTMSLCRLIGQRDEAGERGCLLSVVSAALTGVSGESVLSTDVIEEIVSELVKVIPRSEEIEKSGSDTLNSAVYFVCELATSLFPALKESVRNPGCLSLITELLKLNCTWPRDLNPDLKPLVTNAWQTGLRAVMHCGKESAALLESMAEIIKQSVDREADTLNKLTELTSVGRCLAECTAGQEPQRSLALRYLHTAFMPGHSAWGGLVLSADLPASEPPRGESLTGQRVLKELAPLLFNSAVGTYSSCDACAVRDLCKGVAYCKAVALSPRQAHALHDLNKIQGTLQTELTKALRELDSDGRLEVRGNMVEGARESGGLDSLALACFLENTRTSKGGDFFQVDEIKYEDLREESTHALLAVLPYTSQSQQENLISAMVDCVHQRAGADVTHVMDCHRYLSVLSRLLAAQDASFSGESDAFIVTSTLIPFMQQWPHLEDNFFLFESEITLADWPRVGHVTQVMRLMRVMVEKAPALLTDQHWDFILCSMLSWLQSCSESLGTLLSGETASRTFAIQAFQLVSQVAQCIEGITPEVADSYPPQLRTEWNEFFSQGAYSVLLPVYVKLAESLSLVKGGMADDLLLSAVAMATSHCPLEHLLNHALPVRLQADDRSGMSDGLQTILNHLAPLLLRNHRAVQYCSFTLLKRLTSKVWENEESSSSEEESRRPPSALWDIIDTCKDAMLTWLDGLRIGDKWRPEPYSEEHTAATAYLLATTLLIDLFTAATPPVRAAYASFLKEDNAVSVLMFTLFTLMPDTPVLELKDTLTTQTPTAKLSSSRSLFAEKPAFSCHCECGEGEVGHLACGVYYAVLRHLPALARQWWITQDRRVADLVDRFTSKYVSPILCEEQIREIDQAVFSSSNVKVKTRPVAREVVAIYGVDDASLELLISLPENHPLGPIKVESGKKSGIANSQWRNWMLQLTTFLLHQNGSIADGLLLWKRNVDKKFEGVEECMICFSIIHGSTCHLPKLQCRTCKKKFHSACLYKWFSTSNNSSCPLCRNLF